MHSAPVLDAFFHVIAGLASILENSGFRDTLVVYWGCTQLGLPPEPPRESGGLDGTLKTPAACKHCGCIELQDISGFFPRFTHRKVLVAIPIATAGAAAVLWLLYRCKFAKTCLVFAMA